MATVTKYQGFTAKIEIAVIHASEDNAGCHALLQEFPKLVMSIQDPLVGDIFNFSLGCNLLSVEIYVPVTATTADILEFRKKIESSVSNFKTPQRLDSMPNTPIRK